MADDYDIFAKIGKGRYSEVYTAFDVVKNRKAIVKILKPGLKFQNFPFFFFFFKTKF